METPMSGMKRRTCLTAILGGAIAGVSSPAATAARPIQLHCDLAVDPKREKEMLDNFEKIFRPVARKQPGFIDIKMLKIRDQVRGTAPCRYRFELTMESEELRQKWIATAEHQKAWPTIENTLTDKNFSILVYDVY
jgi:antibiotic biosynthesis monooxygenase (ABM) superfamily enzyme